MELLLKKSIEHLGRVGDVVKVQPGYARNYLLPLGLAVPVNKANLELIEKERVKALAQEAQRLGGLKELAQSLRGTSITIEGRANEEGHLFGSVTAAQIAEALTEKGHAFDARSIRLEHPIKEIGVFDVTVHLHADVDTEVKVWVVQAKPS